MKIPKTQTHIIPTTAPEVIRCVLLCVLEAVEGRLCLLEVVGGAGGTAGDALCATLYTRGCGGWTLFTGGAGGDAPCAALYARGRGG